MLIGVDKCSPGFSEVGLCGHAGQAWPPPQKHWNMVHVVLLKLLQMKQPPWCKMGLPFLLMPLVMGKMTEGENDTCLRGLGAGGAADDRR